MKTVWRVFAYLKRYPGLAAGTLTCAILGTLMVIVFPSVTKWIIDDVVRANRTAEVPFARRKICFRYRHPNCMRQVTMRGVKSV